MSKPIFVATIPGNGVKITEESKIAIREYLNNQLKEDYHVLILFKEGDDGGPSFECFNDCKGLPDIDIDKLINNINNHE